MIVKAYHYPSVEWNFVLAVACQAVNISPSPQISKVAWDSGSWSWFSGSIIVQLHMLFETALTPVWREMYMYLARNTFWGRQWKTLQSQDGSRTFLLSLYDLTVIQATLSWEGPMGHNPRHTSLISPLECNVAYPGEDLQSQQQNMWLRPGLPPNPMPTEGNQCNTHAITLQVPCGSAAYYRPTDW